MKSTTCLLCLRAVALFGSFLRANGDLTFADKSPGIDEAIAKTAKVTRLTLVRLKDFLTVPHFGVHIETDKPGWGLLGQLDSDPKEHEFYKMFDSNRTPPRVVGMVDKEALAEGRRNQKQPGAYWTVAELVNCAGGAPWSIKGVDCIGFAWNVMMSGIGVVACGTCLTEPNKCTFSKSAFKKIAVEKATLDKQGKVTAVVANVLLTEEAFIALKTDLKKLRKKLRDATK